MFYHHRGPPQTGSGFRVPSPWTVGLWHPHRRRVRLTHPETSTQQAPSSWPPRALRGGSPCPHAPPEGTGALAVAGPVGPRVPAPAPSLEAALAGPVKQAEPHEPPTAST